jgi:amino acid adenylation domain-containing protein
VSAPLLLDELAAQRIELHVEDGRLRFRAPPGALTPALKERIAAHREELLAILEKRERPETETYEGAPAAAQERLWFIDQLQGPNHTYNIPLFLRLRGQLDGEALHAALHDLVRRHDSLRTAFVHDGERLSARSTREVDVPWSVLDLGNLSEAERAAALHERAECIAGHHFKLDHAPLFRAELVRIASEEHVLLLCFHHIVTDGWSFGVILHDLAAFYAARLKHQPPALAPLAWRYRDYIAWLDTLRRNGAMDADLAFWHERLAGAPATTTLPPDFSRPSVQTFTGNNVLFALDAPTVAALRTTAKTLGATLNILGLAAIAALIARRTGQRDLVIGLPLANRARRELEPIVGMFVNVVPLRFQIEPEQKLTELVAKIKQAVAEAVSHGNLPFERLLDALGVARDTGLNPVYQIAYNFLPPLDHHPSFAELEVDSPSLLDGPGIAKNDCSIYLDEHRDTIEGHIEYADKLYRPETAASWATELVSLFQTLAGNPQEPVGSVALPGLTGEPQPLPTQSPWELFAARARSAPDAPAIEEDGVVTRYAELQTQAENLAARLHEAGVRHGSRVGLLLPRGRWHIAAMLASLRQGAAFVPLDTTQPAARLATMLRRAELSAIVVHSGTTISEGIAVPQVRAEMSPAGKLPPPATLSAEDAAYLIFTSGSTGEPKGCLLPWRALNNLAHAVIRARGMSPADRSSQLASPSFDASLFEIWPALFSGGTLCIVPDALRMDPPALRDWLVARAITVHFSPTPLAEELLALDWPAGAPLRVLNTGGQTLRRRPRAGVPFTLINNYGPTETGISATWCIVPPGEPESPAPPIGAALPGLRLCVLNEAGTQVPVGGEGELYIGGTGVGLGYFGDPDTTAKSFLSLPGRDGCWYRSGDLVRLRADGSLDYIGRRDGQIKLRGFRIEVGEIEAALLRQPGVAQAAVRKEGESLVAYFEPADGARPVSETLRRALGALLPAYMVPAHCHVVAKLPRSTSGKIDLRSIPESPTGTTARNVPSTIQAPTSSVAAISRAWAAVLGTSATPGIDDNFFDLGGHSLMLVRLKERIRAETGAEIAVLELFQNPTIRRQAAFIDKDTSPDTVSATDTAQKPVPAIPDGAIAIVGMAGRFPEAESVGEFWRNLCAGRDCITLFTREELLAAGVPATLADRPDYVPANGVLKAIDRFDAEFFGIPAREAEVIDPQQRLLLEEAWHCFEDAGLDPARAGGRVGVYVGASLNGYLMENVLPRQDVLDGIGGWAVMLANGTDFAATRLSYKLDLRGPGVSVNTACSTSLVAVHQAVTALQAGQCELALAGGACVRSRQIDGYLYEDGGVLSRDGRTRTFDAAASGMVGGNGVALVLLKPLAAALADGDPIHAVIRGIAANNDGADKIGFTAPGVAGQTRVMQDALARSGVPAESVRYVEAHGTGTRLGDTIEVAALAANYAPVGRRETPMYLGSVKSNVGHLDSAAGVTGLIKAALILREKTLVPSLHFETPNPEIRWPGDAFRVATATEPLAGAGGALRAAVSSLGIGGTNAHAILEEPPSRPVDDTPDEATPHLLLFSGRDARALAANAATTGAWLAAHTSVKLRDAAHTLAFGRRDFAARGAICAWDRTDAAARLAELPPPPEHADSVAFLFTGMGTQKPGMARALYERAPVFRATIDECAALLEPVLKLDLRALLLAAPGDADAMAQLNQHRIGQPTVFAIEYAAARFWMELGLRPTVLIGHSLGEWVAACLAGVFTLADALRLVCLRGGAMDAQAPGAMLAVNLTEPEVAARLPRSLDIATVNAPDQIVVAGPADAVEALALELEREGVRCKRLQVTLAAHSSLMEPMLADFRAAVAAAPRRLPDAGVRVVSNVTGDFLAPERLADPDYWAEHLRRCVRFADGLATLWAQPKLALLECGPSHTLCNLALRDGRRPEGRAVLATLDGEDDPRKEWQRTLETAGGLWAAQLPIDLEKLFALAGPRGRRVSLPGYRFQRKSYWLDPVPTPTVTTAPVRRTIIDESADDEQAATTASPAERQVIAAMRELLGPVRLARTSDFFLSGGDSLLAVRLAARLSEAFGTPVSRAAVFAQRTVGRLAELSPAGDARVSAAEETPAPGCVVRLWEGDERLAPLVFVHAVGGGAFIYRDLLEALRPACPVYGLQSPGLWSDDESPVTGLTEQARLYCESLKQAGGRAPALIGGTSYGGIVAYEMARFYREEGHAVPVAMFDSPGPGHMPERIDGEIEILAYVAQGYGDIGYEGALAHLRPLDHERRMTWLLDLVRRGSMSGTSRRDLERQLAVFQRNLANMWEWQPTPHAARIFYYKAAQHSTLLARTPELAWIPLAGAGIEIVPGQGTHYTMTDAPHVNVLASHLTRRLSESPYL